MKTLSINTPFHQLISWKFLNLGKINIKKVELLEIKN